MKFITEKGFILPTVDEIFDRKLADFKTVKPDIRITDSNVIIPLLKFDAAEEYDSYLMGLATYNNLNAYTAVGTSLSHITSHLNMTWLKPTKARTKIKITTNKNVVIPQAWGIETESGVKFVTLNTSELTLKQGTTEIDVISLEAGKDNNVNAGTITKMTQVINGITKITNTIPATLGRDLETDTELRERYFERIDRKTSFNTAGIRNYLLENTLIKKCQVIENDTDITDAEGRLPHSYEAVCLGDTDNNIFQALYDYKVAGIRTVGDIKKQFGDITVGFSRAIERQLHFSIRISAIRELWLADYPNIIKKIIQNYVDTIEPQGTIYLYKILGEIYKSTGGIRTIEIKIGNNQAELNARDYTLNRKEIAVVLPQNINLNVEVI